MNPAVILIALFLLSGEEGSKNYITSASLRPNSPRIPRIPMPRIPTKIEPFQLELMVDKLRDTAESLDKIKAIGGLRNTLPTVLPQMVPQMLPFLLNQASTLQTSSRQPANFQSHEENPMDTIRDFLADHKESSQQKGATNQMAEMMSALAPFLAGMKNRE